MHEQFMERKTDEQVRAQQDIAKQLTRLADAGEELLRLTKLAMVEDGILNSSQARFEG